MLRLLSESALKVLSPGPQSRGFASCAATAVLSRPLENNSLIIPGHPCGNGDIPYNSLCGLRSSRSMSRYVIRYEKTKARRGFVPKIQTAVAHMPDYVNDEMPNQEDNKETRAITADVVDRVNTQIIERSHGRLFAVVHLQGKQFKITPEDMIIVHGYWQPTVGDRIRLEKVLLAGSSDFTVLGRPTLPRDLVRIEATVIEKSLSYTKLHFTLIKRKNHRRLHFFKIPQTIVRINSIEFDGLVNERKEIEGQRNVIY